MMTRFDIMVIGELNVDLLLNNIDGFPEMGKEILAGAMDLTLGSSSAIFASNCSVLGNKVAFIGKVGDDVFGNLVLDSLKRKKVNTKHIIRSEKEKTGATVILNYDEDRAMVTYPGAMNTLTIDDIDEDDLLKAKHLHISSVFLQPGIKKNIIEIFEKAKNLGLTTSLDIQWDPAEKWDLDFERLLPLVDVFLPNESELKAIMRTEDINEAIDKIRPFVNIMALKMGNKGSMGVTKDKKVVQKPFINHNVVDAIGAGDSFNAGFITKFIVGEPLEECLRFGNLSGAINTTASGGTGAFTSLKEFKNKARTIFKIDL